METTNANLRHPEIATGDLTREIRNATALLRNTNGFVPGFGDSQVGESCESSRESTPQEIARIQSLMLQPAFVINDDNQYEVGSLLQFHNAEFVDAAYRAILKREADPSGLLFYLEGLRERRFDRIDVICALRFSEEGRRHKVRIRGLALPRLMRRATSLPVVGYPLRVCLDFLRLPVLVRRLQDSVAFANSRIQQIAQHLNDTNRRSAAALADVAAALDALRKSSQTQDELQAYANELSLKLVLITEVAEAQERETRELVTRTNHLSRELASQRRTLTVLREIVRRPTSSIDETGLRAIAAEAKHQLDALYVELEDAFRGSPETVKRSFEYYLAYMQTLPRADLSIVDLGCGRGEWLELLKEAGLKAVGVDTNRVMLDRCHERGVEVIESDAVTYLRDLPDDSLRAVTGFHIVEHLTTETLMMLLDEVYRTLQPGGCAVFETPNPENLFVSSTYFYHDPSHRHPLPGLLMKFLLESRGLQRVEIISLHPCEEGRFNEVDEVSKRLNDLFYGAMDYAIMGWKLDK